MPMSATLPTPPGRIGPYRIEGRLGAGGMGEVFLAWDERLDRAVAVKLIRAGSAHDDRARERFRREARAAARLGHPSIVQVHDILETAEGDAIVLELVEGVPLGHRLREGPLELPLALRLAREVASGLAAAHAKGVLHRDLKAENVMLTEDGHAKILDFGLAKRLEPESDEVTLTREHSVLGTSRSMSPEQARGLPLDVRSDLFSLGTLLYEMFTGRSPFQADTPFETLTRVCTARQAPVRELRPELPEEVSSLVDRLLEKDPTLRPSSARAVEWELERLDRTVAAGSDEATLVAGPFVPGSLVSMEPPASRERSSEPAPGARRRLLWIAAGALLAALAAAGVYHRLGRPAEPLYVAVPRPDVLAGADASGADASGVAVLAASLRGSLLDGLLSLEGLRPIPREEMEPVSSASADAIARATGAEEVFVSRLACDPRICQVTLDRLRAEDGGLLWTKSFTAPVEQPYLLAEAVRGHLRQAYPGRRPLPGADELEVAVDDYAEYLRLYHSFDTRREQELSIDEVLDRLAGIRRSSPRFLDTYIFESYMLQHRFRSGRDPGDLERAFEALSHARRLAPDDPRPWSGTFEVAFLAEDLDRAEEALRELERLQPGDARLLAQRARLLERRGSPEEARALLREATERLPSWRHLFWSAEMEYRQGNVEAARGHLQELLRRSPGNLTGRSLLAQIELFYGDPEEAAGLYRELVRQSPRLTYLTNLGTAWMLLGRFGEAEASFRRAVEIQPRNPFVALNLADTLALQGRQAEAREAYLAALRLAEEDPTADSNWQIYSTRAQVLAHLGRSTEAVAAVQEALRLAPSNPQLAYEASLVYMLLGDRASALFNARRALEQGVEPRWFTFPWFGPLRSAPELRAHFTAPG
jgi:eukaryotic-like serine/threonine-protein kinase